MMSYDLDIFLVSPSLATVAQCTSQLSSSWLFHAFLVSPFPEVTVQQILHLLK